MASTTTSETGSAVGFGRRKVAAVCLMLAPIAGMVEMASWPVGSDGSTAQQLQSAAAHPLMYTVAWLAESTSAVLLLVGVAAVLGYLRHRGRTLALIGAPLVGLGQAIILTGGGFNAATVTLAQQPERDIMIRTLDAFNGSTLLHVLAAFIWGGLVGTVLVVIAAVRGGLLRWWALALVVVAIVTVPVLDNNLYGLAAAATALPLAVVQIWLGVALFRTRRASSPVEALVRARSVEPAAEAAVS